MKIIIAPDSFKGSLSSRQVCELVAEVVCARFPDCQTVKLPMADGGEGTLSAVLSCCSGQMVQAVVHDPDMKPITAVYGLLDDNTAVIESAQASGLGLIDIVQSNPLDRSSYGTGELIKAALEKGCKNIIVTLGGSATNDGGLGALAALGVKFYDAKRNELEPLPKNLGQIYRINSNGLCPLVKESRFTIWCDVTNPLYGQAGATRIFGPQKGLKPPQIAFVENAMQNYARLLNRQINGDINERKGTGAAGGLGAALAVFLHEQIKQGAEELLQLTNFDILLNNADLVITGEGRADRQSLSGKVVGAVARHAKKKNIPVVAVVGSLGEEAKMLYQEGVTDFVSLSEQTSELADAINNAELFLKQALDKYFLTYNSRL